jgi:hypothetical protein
MTNNFTDLTRALYSFEHSCWVCGSNQGCELHHILGRISASPFNACVLCRKCHEKAVILNKGKLLKMAIQFCLREQYEPNKTDIKFYKQNAKLYT